MSEIMHTGYPVEKPAKNWHERAEKVGDKMEKVADQAEQKIWQIGKSIDKKFTEKGWKDKLNNVFKKKTTEQQKEEEE